MSTPQPRDKEFLDKHLSQLVGATIISARGDIEAESGELWPTIVLRLANGKEAQLEVSRDEEGNGPGFLFFAVIDEWKEAKNE